MSGQGGVTLRILERADKEILALSRTGKGAVYEFQDLFRRNPWNPKLRFKRLSGDPRLWSARVGNDFRALLLHVGGQDYLLVSVRDRKDVYDSLDRYQYQINRVTGGIEVVDLSPVGDSIVGRLLPPDPDGHRPHERRPDGGVEAKPGDDGPRGATGHTVVSGGEKAGGEKAGGEKAGEAGDADAAEKGGPRPLFAGISDEILLDLGVSEPLIPLIRRIVTEDELLALADIAPQLTADVLLALYDGKTYEQVLEEVTDPVRADEPVNPDDFAAAVQRPSTQVTSNDEALRAILAESFARWQVFLHPTQRKLVERRYNGPARVGGGPGTGKTIVALHRARYLAEHLPPGDDKPILLTTFNRNLAADLRTRLLALAGPELLARVDIVNIDKLAGRIVAEAGLDSRRRIVDDTVAAERWQAMLLELGETRWDPQFLAAEWSQVVLGQVLNSRTDYFKARRPGRGRALTRQDRDVIWRLTERFEKRLEDDGIWTWRQLAGRAARLEMDRQAQIQRALRGQHSSGSTLRYRYRHVIVDEAQDLGAAHWKMLRAMVPPMPDDMFLAGDTHQRIYDNYVTLGSLGINIRGRSARLTLSYRTTRQILGTALELLSGETYDDLDGGEENLAGYRSLLRGGRPALRGVGTWAEEQQLISRQVRTWLAAPDGPPADSSATGGLPSDGSIAVCVPTRQMAGEVIQRLTEDGIIAVEIGPEGPKRHDGVHVGTMHRFKGLEYRRMIIGGVCAGLVPRSAIESYQDSDPKRYLRERMRDRSLLFVAATRARDDLTIFWHGTPSPFLAVTHS
ncbi:UvrD-helicase domain-containing protein [Frankia sp. CiP1_Cm_nod2]|uniref:UvrD-helicase domain-containing protein n=1 Tax=Frankia sp. CiP1_Cm_nod2 TaxID=2897161 RepID=UPI0020241953